MRLELADGPALAFGIDPRGLRQIEVAHRHPPERARDRASLAAFDLERGPLRHDRGDASRFESARGDVR
jgi:hypothetical protein